MAKTLFLSDPGAIENASLERRAKIQTAILDCNADAIVVGDPSGVVYANPAAKKLLGDGLLAGWFVLLPNGEPCPDDALPMARAIRGEPFDGDELRLRRPASSEVWVSVSGRQLMAEGAARGGVVTFRDVTEKKAMERRLLLSDRMATIGTLAAGIAHEVNNPLMILIGNLELALEAMSEGKTDNVARFLGTARNGGTRVERIVADLRTLSSGSDVMAPVDLAAVIDSAIVLVGKSVKSKAKIVPRVVPSPKVFGNEPRLGQVLLNLVVNAAQAIPEGSPDTHEIRVSLHPEGAHVILEVEDTGKGISPEVLPRIFEPFFTTKPVGEGTGLGLWITHGIVTSIGGEISVSSVPGRTTFRLTFPAARPAP